MFIELVVKCIACDEDQKIMAKENDVLDWMGGKLIQDALPYLSKEQREIMISHTCPECWNNMFSLEEYV